jgi:pyrimidine-specific ribonucleoside hydrolase
MTALNQENGGCRHTGRIPLIIDCDPGIDDAVALALAVASPEIDLLAVTTVAGNAPLERTTDNALRLLELLGRPDVPVAGGATRALVRAGVHNRRSPHGVNGLGGIELASDSTAPAPYHAVDVLASALSDSTGPPITIAALGPLTNIALLLARYPELSTRIHQLVVMGGCIGRGNITPVAEFNVWTDPEAAQRVLTDSDLAIHIVGLNVTRSAVADDAMLATLRTRSRQGSVLANMVHAYGDRVPGGRPLHDVLALACVVDPGIVSSAPASVEVDTGSGPARGQTIYVLDEWREFYAVADPQPPGPTHRVQVALDVGVARFQRLVLERVGIPQGP